MMPECQEPENWLRTRRGALGWTQEQVARAADVSLRTIYSAEAGRAALKPKIRQRIEQALEDAENIRSKT